MDRSRRTSLPVKWAQHGRTEDTGYKTILVRDKQKHLCPGTLSGIPPPLASTLKSSS